MKKATAILLSSVIFASLLCSCGKAADSSAVSSAVSTKTIAIQQIIANSRRNGTSLHSPAE